MHAVTLQTELDIATLDGVMRAVFGARISGVSLYEDGFGEAWFYEEPTDADRAMVAVALLGGEYGDIEAHWTGKVEAIWA